MKEEYRLSMIREAEDFLKLYDIENAFKSYVLGKSIPGLLKVKYLISKNGGQEKFKKIDEDINSIIKEYLSETEIKSLPGAN
jgi:hypothetical protein